MAFSMSAGFVDHIGLPFVSWMKVPPSVNMPAECALTVLRSRLRFFPSGVMVCVSSLFFFEIEYASSLFRFCSGMAIVLRSERILS